MPSRFSSMAISCASSCLVQNLARLCEPLRESLLVTPYSPPEAYPHVSVKSHLLSLLPETSISEQDTRALIRQFALFCAALASASNTTSRHLSWVSDSLSLQAISTLKEFARVCCDDDDYFRGNCSIKVGDLELDFSGIVESEAKFVIKVIPDVFPLLKDEIKKSSIDADDENGRNSSASAGVPLAFAVLAASQFRWLATKVDAPWIGNLIPFLIPCALTALDHWSPQVKDQGMMALIHLAKKSKASDFGGYTDVILDACCRNIVCDDEIWPFSVEMSVLLVTLTQERNPRSQWYAVLFSVDAIR
ncbi:hypothetical protein M569_15984 [Genlisea aurea]|uniref:Uncharacterized protein n=1 Tax=Genlisea aurea TaxID=192259 RepID=S8DHM9_9LAMI|nr:hypothetical protein M569_15984 [Genlisea aurea]